MRFSLGLEALANYSDSVIDYLNELEKQAKACGLYNSSKSCMRI
jgi:hypothetical protein